MECGEKYKEEKSGGKNEVYCGGKNDDEVKLADNIVLPDRTIKGPTEATAFGVGVRTE